MTTAESQSGLILAKEEPESQGDPIPGSEEQQESRPALRHYSRHKERSKQHHSSFGGVGPLLEHF